MTAPRDLRPRPTSGAFDGPLGAWLAGLAALRAEHRFAAWAGGFALRVAPVALQAPGAAPLWSAPRAAVVRGADSGPTRWPRGAR